MLEYFVVEPFVPHEASDEYYLAIRSGRDGDEILFHHEGGVDVGDVDSKALVRCPDTCSFKATLLIINTATFLTLQKVMVAVDESVSVDTVRSKLLTSETIPAERRELLAEFIALLHAIYVDLHFTYLEINPLVVVRPHLKPLVADVMRRGQLS